MADIPEGAIPVDQFQAAAPVHQDATQVPPHPEAIPVDQFESAEDTYGTPGEMLKTAAEGAAKGILGPIAPWVEKNLGGARTADMRAREEENPISSAVGQIGGLGASMLTGVGEGAIMSKIGTGAQEAVGLANLAKEAPLLHKVGSVAVQQAAEMAVLQGSDEVSKQIMQDPNASSESAIANIGLAAALGGIGGAAFGSISPLWEATAGPQVEKLLNTVKDHLNGGVAVLPEELAAAKSAVGVAIPKELEAAMSGNPLAVEHFNTLNEVQNKTIRGGIENFHKEVSNKIAEGLGIDLNDVAVHSEAEAGHGILDSFKKEYKEKYAPMAEAFDKRNAEAAKILVPDDARLAHYGRMLESGMNKVGTDSPLYKLYNDYGQRVLAKDTVGGLDMLKTELGGEIDKAMRAADTNSLHVLRDIRSSIADLQENQILRQAETAGAGKLGEELVAERAGLNKQYKDFANMSNELTDHLGVGRFSGATSLTQKLVEKVSAEQLVNKFSIKGNADFIPFLQKNFPEVYEKVRQNELKRFLKPAVLGAREGEEISIKKLNSVIEKGMAGQKEYVQSILPPGALERIQAANKLMEAIPHPKSSGTAGWLSKTLADMPRSAMAAVAMTTGHNPVMGGIIGEMAQKLGRDVPDALRLAHLRFLASDAPVKASGFKAMVDFIHNTYKAENMLGKATKAVLKSGAQVLTDKMMPNEADRQKLDKAISKIQDNPNILINAQNGQLGHYLPNHQTALTATTTNAMQYLNSIKPREHTFGPLDKPIPPQPVEIARYNRALNIAQSPMTVLQHVKDGTLQPSDIQDLHSMYPSLYQQMAKKLTNEVVNHKADDGMIPYKTRVGISMFLGQPMDASMQPLSIQSAQPKPKPMPQQGPAPGAGPKSTKSLGKNIPSYMTPNQAAEAHKQKND